MKFVFLTTAALGALCSMPLLSQSGSVIASATTCECGTDAGCTDCVCVDDACPCASCDEYDCDRRCCGTDSCCNKDRSCTLDAETGACCNDDKRTLDSTTVKTES